MTLSTAFSCVGLFSGLVAVGILYRIVAQSTGRGVGLLDPRARWANPSEQQRAAPSQTRISGVAILHEGIVYSLLAPARHGDVIRMMVEQYQLAKPIPQSAQQGFITERGAFVSRKEALRIARAARQIKEDRAVTDELYSEDVW